MGFLFFTLFLLNLDSLYIYILYCIVLKRGKRKRKKMATFIEAEAELSRAASVRSWKSTSVREIWQQAAQPDVFSRNSTTKSERNNDNNGDDEEELMWAAIERLPTYDRVRKGMILTQVNSKGKKVFGDEVVDVTKLGSIDKKLLIDSVLKIVENDNEKLLTRIRDRVDR